MENKAPTKSPAKKRVSGRRKIKIDVGHKLEILDRSHCLNVMFEETIANHLAASLVPEEIEAVRVAINALYQKTGAIYHDHKD